MSTLALVASTATASASSSAPARLSHASGATAHGTDQSTFSVLLTTEDTQTPAELQKLATTSCKTEAQAQPISLQQTPSQNIESKIQLLASQNSLPLMYAASNPDIIPGGSLVKKGDVLNIETALSQLGVANDMTPLALSTTKAQFQGGVPSVPFQMNIEGLFYNKRIFANHHLTQPKTFAQLLADAAVLKKAHVIPFSASGASGWTISRWVGILLFRELGPNAMNLIAHKKAKLTSAAYMTAAEQVAQMGKDGYFSPGITNLSYNAAVAQFLDGKSAMMYMGTWLLAEILSSQNKVGRNNIGFMPFPAVTGGKGSIDQYPANTGSPNVLNPHVYGPHAQAWLKCIAENYGSASLQDQGVFTGFRTNQPVTGLAPITQTIQKTINSAKQSVLWFEALFGLKANDDASGNAAALVTGAMSPQQYMGILQADQSQP
ncbi:MAG: extracellular solute-binding protein [Actinomycetota bacterium]|nr:extracellular solute-binding protein [Actinomycetota bacterium]